MDTRLVNKSSKGSLSRLGRIPRDRMSSGLALVSWPMTC